MLITSPEKDTQTVTKNQPAKLANAIPLTLVFIVLISGLIYFQHYFTINKVATTAIAVNSEGNEQLFASVEITDTVDVSEKIIDLADLLETQYINGEVKARELLEAPPLQLITEKNQKLSILFHIIKNLVARRDYQSALPVYELMTPEERENYSLSFGYAQSLSKTDNFSKAMEEYKLFVKKYPRNQAALINLGLLLLKQKQFQEAKVLYTKGLSFVSGAHKAKVYSGLADSEIALSEPIKAIEYYKKSIEYSPTNALTWRKLARAERKADKQPSTVIENYARAFELDRNNTRLSIEYSEYLFSVMQFDKAIPLLRKNLKQSKASISERLLLIISYLEQKRPANARKQLDYLKKHVNRRQQRETTVALEQYLERDYRESLKSFKNTLKKNRNNNLGYYLIGLSYLQLDKPKNASAYLIKIKADSLFYNHAQKQLGLASISLGKNQQAQLIFSKLFTHLPDSSNLAFRMASLAYRKNNLDVAYSTINKAILQNPESKKYRLLEARIAWRLSNKAAAIEMLEKILTAHPRYKRAIYRMADYQQLEGNSDAALKYFQQLLEIDRDYSNTLFRIARLLPMTEQALTRAKLLVEYLVGHSDDIDARALLASSYCANDNLTLCREQLLLTLRLDPKNVQVTKLINNFFPTEDLLMINDQTKSKI